MADQLHQTASVTKPPLYVSTKNETVRMFDSDFMEFFSRVHPAIPLILYLPVVGFMLYVALWRQGFPVFVVVGFFAARYAPLDPARISDPPIHFPLRTENARGKTAPLHHSRRASRLSKRREKACYAAEYQCAARISFLRHVPANLRALCVQCVRRIGVWLSSVTTCSIMRRIIFR